MKRIANGQEIQNPLKDIILPQVFFKTLAQKIADAQTYKGPRTKKTVSKQDVLAFIKEIYDNTPKNLIKMNLEEIEKLLNYRGILDKLVKVSYEVDSQITSIRIHSFNNIYITPSRLAKVNPPEEAYFHYINPEEEDKERFQNWYTQAIDNDLAIYLTRLEDALKNNFDEKILERKVYRYTPIDDIKDDDSNTPLKNLLRMARGTREGLALIWFYEIREAEKKGEVFGLMSKEKEIIVNLARELVLAYIDIAQKKAEAKVIENSLQNGWEEATEEETKKRFQEMTSPQREASDREWREAIKMDAEGIFYPLPESVKNFGRDVKEMSGELKEGAVVIAKKGFGGLEHIGRTGFSWVKRSWISTDKAENKKKAGLQTILP